MVVAIFPRIFKTIHQPNFMSRKKNVPTEQAEPSTGSRETPQISIPAFVTPGRVAVMAGVIAFAVYLTTMNQTFGFVDKGELVAVASTLGIAHPTGYPTIMTLGFLFTKILPLREVLALNILSALLTATGVGLLTLLFNDLLGRIVHQGDPVQRTSPATKGRKEKNAKRPALSGGLAAISISNPARALYAGIGALCVGFSPTWWDQSNGFEVYSLHAFFMPLVILLFLRHCDREALLHREISNKGDIGIARFTREGFLFALVLGLSFTNHLTTVLMAPALLFYYFRMVGSLGGRPWGTGAHAVRRLAVLVGPFLLGLLPYLWLPIRASMQPEFNWGNPTDVGRFVDHIAGKQYQVWFNAGWEVFKQQSSFFFGGLSAQLGYIGIALVILGLLLLVRRNRFIGILTGLLFVTCIAWSGNYDIMEIGPYYMTAILALGIFAVAGLVWLHERFGTTAAVAFGAATLALAISMNHSVSNESNNTMVEDMTRNVLENAPPKSLILSSMWDYWVAGSFYMQGVENLRRDVIVVDQELLRRSWYIDQLAHNHPEFMARVKPQTDAFMEQVYKFEHDLPYNPTEIDMAYYGMINAMIDSSIAQRPVFVTAELSEQIAPSYRRVPNHLLYRLAGDSNYLPEKFPTYRFTPNPGRIDYYTAKIHQLYAASLFDRGSYEHTNGRDSLAKLYYNYALGFDPGFKRDGIPNLPLRSNDQVVRVIEFFEKLQGAGK